MEFLLSEKLTVTKIFQLASPASPLSWWCAGYHWLAIVSCPQDEFLNCLKYYRIFFISDINPRQPYLDSVRVIWQVTNVHNPPPRQSHGVSTQVRNGQAGRNGRHSQTSEINCLQTSIVSLKWFGEILRERIVGRSREIENENNYQCSGCQVREDFS